MTPLEILAAFIREAEEHKSTKQWTSSDDAKSSCMTVRIPVALVNRAKEAIAAEKIAARQHQQHAS